MPDACRILTASSVEIVCLITASSAETKKRRFPFPESVPLVCLGFRQEYLSNSWSGIPSTLEADSLLINPCFHKAFLGG